MISLDEEARLYNTNAERERAGLLATLFGIIVALDYLEKAFVRDAIGAAECVLLSLSSLLSRVGGSKRMVEMILMVGCGRGIRPRALACSRNTRLCSSLLETRCQASTSS
jgi:hypothetical protein